MANKKIKGLTVEIGGDTTKLGKAIDDSKKKSKSLQSELKQVEKLLKLDPKNVELVAQKQKILAEQVEETKKRLSLLKDEQSKVNELYKKGEIGEEDYRKYRRDVEQTEIKLKNLETQLKTTGDQFAEMQRKSGAVTFQNAENKVEHFKGKVHDFKEAALKDMQEVSDGFNKAGDKLEKVGGVLNKGSAAAAAVLAGSVASFKDLDDGYDVIVKKTGATDEKFDSLKKTADELFSGSTFDMTAIGNAIGEVNTRFGYTEDKLRSVTEQYLQFAKINDADVSDSVSKTARIMQAWDISAENLPDLLGMITAKGQETGVAVGGLMDKVLDNNATFKEMGLSLEESISLMAQFEKNGVNDSTALTAMKAAVKNAAKEGKSLSEWLTQTVDDIKNASGETEALQKATELFGTKGAAEMANAIKEGRIDFDNLSGSMSNYKDTVKKTYDATVDPLEESAQVINNLKLAGTELAATALKEGQPLIEDVIDGVKAVTNWLKKLTPEQKKALTKAIETIAVVGPGVTIVGKLSKGIGSVVGILPKAAKAAKGFGAALSSNPVGAAALAVSALAAAVIGLNAAYDDYNKNAWQTSSMKKYVGEVDAAAARLKETSDSLVETTKTTMNSLDEQFTENALIDSYQERLNELLATPESLTDKEKAELNNIVTYLGNNVDGFTEAWNKYTLTDENGNIKIVGELQTVRDELNLTIDEAQKVANKAALSEFISETGKSLLATKIKLQQQQNTTDELEKQFESKLSGTGLSMDSFRGLYNKFGDDYKTLVNYYGTNPWEKPSDLDLSKVTSIEYQDLYKAFESLHNYRSELSTLQSDYEKTSELAKDLSETQLVLNGNYDDAAAVLMAYNAGYIKIEDINKSQWRTLDNLEKEAAKTHKNTVIGVGKDLDELGTEVTSKQQSLEESFTSRLTISNDKYRAAVSNYNSLKAQFDADVPGVTEKMVKAAEETVQKYASEFGELPDLGGKAISDTTEVVKGNTPALRRGMGSAGELARDEFTIPMKEGTDSVKDAVSGTTKAIENETPNLENASEKASEAIKNNFDNLDLEEKGGNIILGLLKGLWNNSIFSKIGETVGNVSSAIYNAFTSWWDMHSPAKKSGPLGENITLGITKKMPTQHRAIKKASAEVNKDIMKSLSETAKSYFQGKDYLLEPTFSTLSTMTDYSVTHTHDFQQSAELRAMRNDIKNLSTKIEELAKNPSKLYLDGKTLIGGTIGEIDRQLASVEFFKNRGV